MQKFIFHIWVCINHSFIIHSVFCLTTGPKPPPKRCLHIERSRASSFKTEYPLLSLRSSSSFLRLLTRILATSISPFIFPSITCINNTENNYNESSKDKTANENKASNFRKKSTKCATELWHSNHSAIIFLRKEI